MMSDSEFCHSVYRDSVEPLADRTIAFIENYSSNDPLGVAEEQAPPAVLEKMAANRDCSVDLLTLLSDHTDVRVRCAVASNPGLPEAIMWKLAADSDFHVRCRLAKNEYANEFVLESLAEDEHPTVAARAERTLAQQSSSTTLGKVIHWLFPRELKRTG